MFDLNFRDERLLPFEGAGVKSTWRIEMPKDCNAFDFETISDVIMTMKYTSLEGGVLLQNSARKALELSPLPDDSIVKADDEKKNLTRLFNLRHEFQNDWYNFLEPTKSDPADESTYEHNLEIELKQERFPFQFRSPSKWTISIDSDTILENQGRLSIQEATLFYSVGRFLHKDL